MCENCTNWIDCDLGASRRMKARRIGIDAAMTDMAGSAVPKILRSTVVAGKLSDASRMTRWEGVALTTAVGNVLERDDLHEGDDAGARDESADVEGRCGWQPDKTPMLMAAKAPNFSRLLIATFHTIFHGRMARTMSMMPE